MTGWRWRVRVDRTILSPTGLNHIQKNTMSIAKEPVGSGMEEWGAFTLETAGSFFPCSKFLLLAPIAFFYSANSGESWGKQDTHQALAVPTLLHASTPQQPLETGTATGPFYRGSGGNWICSLPQVRQLMNSRPEFKTVWVDDAITPHDDLCPWKVHQLQPRDSFKKHPIKGYPVFRINAGPFLKFPFFTEI